MNVLVTLVAIALVDRIGRKPLLVIGSAGMALTLAVMAWCFSQATGTGADLQLPGDIGPIALVAANLYVVFFGVSWGPVVWVLLGEMFPNRIRAIALAVAAAAQWLANFAITATFPKLAEIGLSFAYGLYAAFALISLAFVLVAVRETKGHGAGGDAGLRGLPADFRRSTGAAGLSPPYAATRPSIRPDCVRSSTVRPRA